MRLLGITLLAAVLAAVLVIPAAAQDCIPNDPVPAGETSDSGYPASCLPLPPSSVEVSTHAGSSSATLTDLGPPGVLMPLEAVIPMPLHAVEVVPLAGDSSAPVFSSLAVPMRYQDPGDVSCGIQALGMALDGLGGGAPESSAMLGFLQSKGMMYDFGTGVEELAYAAQSFGYRGSYSFHDGTLADLQTQLDAGHPVTVALGTNGEGAAGHFVTVTGISPDGQWVSYNDPTLGKQTISAEEFQRLWGLQGNSAVVVAKEPPANAPDPAPWVAMAAASMALVSASGLGLQRKGIGGRIDAGAGTTPRRTYSSPRKSAPKPTSRSKPRKRSVSPVKLGPIPPDPPPPPPPQPPFNLAKRKQQDYAAGVAWEQGRAAREAAKAYAAYRAGERKSTPALGTGPIIRRAYEDVVLTDAINLRGGIGSAVTYDQKAEESYTGHSYGGQALPVVRAVGLFKDALVYARDNTHLLDWMHKWGWINRDVSAGVYYRPVDLPAGRGIAITAVDVRSTSPELLYTASVWVDVYSKGIEKPQSVLAYPPSTPILSSPGYGEVSPGDMKRINFQEEVIVPPGGSAIVTITVQSEWDRWGSMSQEVQP